MLGISGWTGLGLAFCGVAITLLTFWLAVRLWGRGQITRPWSPWNIAGNLFWSAILFFAGVIAARYIERVDNAWLGYVAYVLVGFLLSLARAFLYLRATKGRPPRVGLSRTAIVHNLAYLLLALILFLLVSWLTGGPGGPFLLIPLFVGALLPDLDSSESLAGRLLPAISRRFQAWLGHKQAWHTPAAAVVVAILTAPLALLVHHSSLAAWWTIPLGFVAHLLLDLLAPQGIMLLWPLSRTRYHVPGAPLRSHGSPFEHRLAIGLAAVALILVFLVGLGPQPPPPPAPTPSYEQTLDRYHGLRGRYLVFASVQGSWQTSGLRLGAGLFEVLNVVESSYVLLDRYTGKVFTAGRSPEDHVYLDSIGLQTGSQAQIKPVEILLEDEPLGAGLAVLYEMQREPGLQYIYVFGDVLLPAGTGVGLPLDHTLTGVPRIQAEEPGHYRLQYLPAAELIALADVEVETASLLVVATYISPPAGPTATPLPSPAVEGEAGP